MSIKPWRITLSMACGRHCYLAHCAAPPVTQVSVIAIWSGPSDRSVWTSLVPPGRRSRDRHPLHEIGWHAWSRAFERLGFFWGFCRLWPCSGAVAAGALGAYASMPHACLAGARHTAIPAIVCHPRPAMTVPGQTRRFRGLAETSASPPVSDVVGLARFFRDGP